MTTDIRPHQPTGTSINRKIAALVAAATRGVRAANGRRVAFGGASGWPAPHAAGFLAGEFPFRCDPGCAREARSWLAASLHAALGDDPAGAAVIDDAISIASELVSNAIQAECGHGTLSWRLQPGELRLAVADDAPGWPTPLHPCSSHSHGRGLRIVRSLAASTGFRTLEGGKQVWATLTVPAAHAARAERNQDSPDQRVGVLDFPVHGQPDRPEGRGR